MRFHRVGKDIVKTYNEKAPQETERRVIPLVRGYDFNTEQLAFFNVIHNNSADITPAQGRTRWDIKLSLCEWLLNVVKFGDWDPNALDHTVLFALRQAFQTEEKYAVLRRFV